MKFQILCLDSNETVKSKSIKTLIYALLANDKLFQEPIPDFDNKVITDTIYNLKLKIEQFDTSNFATGARYSLAYTLTITCNEIEYLDDYRIIIVDYLKELCFNNIRILIDEVSESFACTLYRSIYQLENKVRSFIVNFFLRNIGINWRDLAIPKETLDKINNRRDNDRIFIKSGKVDSDVILIDFDDLGKILYNEKSILNTRKPDNITIIMDKIKNATSLEELKKDVLEGNFYKYFKDCFAQKDFENKWFELYYYRNKIAHNSYFSKKEVDKCTELCGEISSIIDSAYEKLNTFKLSVSDMEAFAEAVRDINIKELGNSDDIVDDSKSNIIKCSNEGKGFENIDEAALLYELGIACKSLPFVGLKYFVKDILGNKGYSYDSSYTMINLLVDKEILKLNKINNPNGEFDTTAIELNKT